jgi:DNA-binding NtrC family response regulator
VRRATHYRLSRSKTDKEGEDPVRPSTILVVDDEASVRLPLRLALEQAGHNVVEAGSGGEALLQFRAGVDLIILDHWLPDIDGLALLRQIRQADSDATVIMMTASHSVEMVCAAMKVGAFHYLSKPVRIEELLAQVEHGLETARLRREVKVLLAERSQPYCLERIVGESPAMQRIKDLLRKVAGSPSSTVLIVGESGTGKDLVAKAIHYNSDRHARPFMNITCSALPETLLESELFGHERGAFTDARQQKRGLLEVADGGTVFLDEFTETTSATQAKLLRFLEEKSFKRVGGTADIRVDVRVVAASNRDLEEAVARGRLRRDLYYRLSVLPVRLPPLRERRQDIALLAQYFVESYNQEFRKHVRGLTPEATARLTAHDWPGNVRELRNAIERAMLFAEGDRLGAEDLKVLPGASPVASAPEGPAAILLPACGVDGRGLIGQALERGGPDRGRAAALLKMRPEELREVMLRLGMS